MTAVWIVILLAVLLAGWIVWTFNRLIRLRNYVAEAWGGIDVQLRRRHDLIPNLVEMAEAYRVHEKSVLETVTDLRAKSGAAEGVTARGAAEGRLGAALASLFAVAENYPDLKASDVYRDVQRDLGDVEDHLQMARRYYNGTVRNLNNAAETFPSSQIARVAGIGPAEFFELDDPAARAAPDVG